MVDDIVRDTAARLPSGSPSGTQKNTLSLLKHLAGLGGSGATQDDLVGLDALRRKVSVARRLWVSYDQAWSRPATKEPAPGLAYLVLAALLFQFGCEALRAGDKGTGLNRVNGALYALDLVSTSGEGLHIEALRRQIIETLEPYGSNP